MTLDLKNLESNCCPVMTCGSTFFKDATCYDRGIHCNQCGHITPIETYKKVMRKYVLENFINVKSKDDE